ncbi:MAG: N-6 DNA methylase, partial [Anaerolineae bacterium]|nr:N-6 DNA methylase [Anaerolineae bacterium]
MEGRVEGGYPDLQLLTQEGDPWVVGDLKLDDTYLSQPDQADKLWQEKSKYVSGLTRYVLFLTPRYLQLRRADGQVLKTLYLPSLTLDQLRQELCEISWEKAQHESQWARLVEGKLPYGYLKLDAEGTKRLKEDLRASFGELMEAAEKALEDLERRYQEYRARLADAEKSFGGASEDTRRRALARIEGKYPTALKALFTAHLPRFVDQYGGEIEGKLEEGNPRIREAFAADSAAALMARVLFLRFLEDLGLTKRRLTNGGPERWGAFVESLAKSAAALVKVSSMDLKGAYQEPFEEETFAWVLEVNGQMDQALQRLILRVNAYNFQELSEEVLGEIYQDFLPPEKRKRLGEFYTPSFIVDYILRETALAHPDDELPEVLDPACGSGSFLVRYFHQVVEEHRKRGLEVDLERLRETIWGFDINPFASYISTFQLLWGQLRVDSKSRPKVHVYNLNALVRDDHISAQIGKEHLTPGELARDEKKWSYVVGNPPYIRAERIKYGEEMQNLYHHVWGPNGDTGLIFLWRSLQDWLKEGGKLGMVVSGGYASSEAAAKVWSLLWPGQGYALRKLVW